MACVQISHRDVAAGAEVLEEDRLLVSGPPEGHTFDVNEDRAICVQKSIETEDVSNESRRGDVEVVPSGDSDVDEPLLNDALQPLDVPDPTLHAKLTPMRIRMRSKIEESLKIYDAGRNYPRPQDRQYETRDGYEYHLRNEALRELRQTVRRVCTEDQSAPQWKVIGGAERGGIVVRTGHDLDSSQTEERLSTGAVVEEIGMKGDRLNYTLLTGNGPRTGWVSTKIRVRGTEKPLAIPNASREEYAQLSRPRALITIVALMAAHISNENRIRRLRYALQSINRQQLGGAGIEFIVVVSWSASSELAEKVDNTMKNFVEERPPGSQEFVKVVVEQKRPRSQFQHFLAAHVAADAELRKRQTSESIRRSIWIIFGDDDDIWHQSRVSEYVRAIRAHPSPCGVAIFGTVTRATCKENVPIVEGEMPVTVAEVYDFIAKRRATDREEMRKTWSRRLRGAGVNADLLTTEDGITFEYFDFLPRFRLLTEFFRRTSPNIVAHRYCDLRFLEFMVTYPRTGDEMGLQIAYFEPSCWMYFYACAGIDQRQWARSIEGSGEGDVELQPRSIGIQGHMATEVAVEDEDIAVAKRSLEGFREVDPNLTLSRLVRYWVAFRNALELYFVPQHWRKMDQRVFDACVYMAVNGCFFNFAERVTKLPETRSAVAANMMFKTGQGFAKSLASKCSLVVLWHRPYEFIEPQWSWDHGLEEEPKISPYAALQGKFGAKSWTGTNPWYNAWYKKGVGKGSKGPWKGGHLTAPWSKEGGKGKPHAFSKSFGGDQRPAGPGNLTGKVNSLSFSASLVGHAPSNF